MSQPDIIILEDCGSGLYGKVYKARQPKLGRDVAVKIINSEWPNAADALSHARALIKVAGHQNIVTVHDVTQVTIEGFENDHEAIIMEWIDGESLGERFSGKKFSEEEAEKICKGMLAGIEYMHSKEMAHGDLHPGNIMLMSDYTPKIIDIDPHQDNTLARLSTISKEGAVANDIGYFTRGAISVLQRTNIPRFQINELDTELSNADSLEQIRAIVDKFFNEPRPITLPVHGNSAVEPSESLAEQVQDYIEDDKPVRLRKLMQRQVKLVCDELISDRFWVQGKLGDDTIRQRVEDMEETIGPLLPALAAGAYWGNDSHTQLWRECIESVANVYEETKNWGGNVALLELRSYPPLIMLYSMGIGAYWNNQYNTLRVLLRECKLQRQDRVRPLSGELYHWKVNNKDLWNKRVLKDGRRFTPISDQLLDITQASMSDLTFNQGNFERRFDQFEYLLGVIEAYGEGATKVESTWNTTSWGPIGSFIWRQGTRGESVESLGENLINDVADYPISVVSRSILDSGLFQGSKDELKNAVTNYNQCIREVRGQYS
ncbi:MAG: hypothetical protein COA78_14835 [Blastopirellula sp.]|nr:MAG: hypothetical protein COA78_14835 [Blastopirellula sp.]